MSIIKRYVKKPIPVEACFLSDETLPLVVKWIVDNGGKVKTVSVTEGILEIETLEGPMKGRINKCYIVRGVKGEFYVVDKDIFEETYMLAYDSESSGEPTDS